MSGVARGSQGEPAAPAPKCLRCGSALIAAGAVYAPARLSFRADAAKFLTLETGDIMTKASMCRECGLVQITGDVNKLRRLSSLADPTGGAS